MQAIETTVDIIAGARPNFVKIASVINEFIKRRKRDGALRYRLIHTGQHYDERMSGQFFDQLGIPAPDINLEVGSGTQAEQTALIMVAYEKLLLKQRSALTLVFGDVNSTLACAIAAQKLHIPVAHVEAGIRSGDWKMPEEINRLVTDAISNYYFTTSRKAGENLRNSGVEPDRIHFVGNTMIDTLLANLERLRPPSVWHEKALVPGAYVVVTLHRPANVDSPAILAAYLKSVCHHAMGEPVIFPVHPRTEKTLGAIRHLPENLNVIEPQAYLEFNYLVKHARAVVTDSGGITEEATVLGIPCMTLRDNTERPETVEQGTNVLIGTDAAALDPAFQRLYRGEWKTGQIPERWDGKASERIVAALEKILLGDQDTSCCEPVAEKYSEHTRIASTGN